MKKLSFNSYATEWINNINKNKYVCIFGAGTLGKEWCSLIEENKLPLKIDFIVDNDNTKWGKKIYGKYKCISPNDLEIYKDEISIIIATKYVEEIKKQLVDNGFKNIFIANKNRIYFLSNYIYCTNTQKFLEARKKFNKLIDICSDEKSKEVCYQIFSNWALEDFNNINKSEDQYFLDEIFKLNRNEYFVDCGSYIGDTIDSFINKVKSFEKIYAFELDKNIYENLNNNVNKYSDYKKFELYNIGVSNRRGTIKYNSNDVSSTISDEGEYLGFVDKLDEILKNKKITLIKMDIEGQEINALKGGEKLIKNQKPKLAICIYHKPEHLWEIPLYIKSIVPEYKIFIRHHSDNYTETVCYAKI